MLQANTIGLFAHKDVAWWKRRCLAGSSESELNFERGPLLFNVAESNSEFDSTSGTTSIRAWSSFLTTTTYIFLDLHTVPKTAQKRHVELQKGPRATFDGPDGRLSYTD